MAVSLTHFCPDDSVSTRFGSYLGPSTRPVVLHVLGLVGRPRHVGPDSR